MNVRPESFRLFSRAAATLLLALFTTATAWADTVETYYVDADGTTHTGITATVLTGSETTLEAGTWYYLQTSIAYDHALKLGNGEVTLILGNGATMSFPQADIIALNGDNNANSSLTIYGQTLDDSQAGKLVCTGVHTGIRVRKTYTQHSGTVELSGYHSKLLSAGAATVADGSIIVNGGKLMVNYSGSADYAIQATKSITFNGGKMEVTTTNGSMAAVQCSYWSSGNNVAGTITLGWTNASDYIHASSYEGTVNIASGKAFTTDGTDIYSGSGVTGIDGKTLTPAVAVTLADGITATGGIITSGDDNYAKVGATVTVSTSGVTVPEGYTLGGITVTPAVTVTDQGSGSYSFTVPAANVSVSAQFDALASSVAYIDENGVVQYKQPGEYTVLDGTETRLGSYGTTTWYVVNSDISHDGEIDCYGDVHIILCDGKTMTVNGGENYGIDGLNVTIYGQTLGTGTLDASSTVSAAIRSSVGNVVINGGTVTATSTTNGINSNVTINGGTVNATTTNTSGTCIFALNFAIINGGNVTATGGAVGIQVINSSGNITISGGTVNADGSEGGIIAPNTTISGGTVNATGGEYGISGNNVTISGGQVKAIGGSDNMFCGGIIGGTITLGWTNANDYIHASRYSFDNITVNIASGKTLYDEDNTPYSGTIEKVNGAFPINGKTLRPLDYVLVLNDDADNSDAIAASTGQRNVILQGRTLYKDGAWNTLCLPFSVDLTASGTLSGDNVQAMTLNTATSTFADGTLTLNFTDATGQTIPAGTPFIIKWDESGTDITNPVFEGVTVSNATNDATVEGVLTFTGTYAPKVIGGDGDNTVLYLGAEDQLYYPTTAVTIGTHRAYFQLAEGITAGEPASGVRSFVLNFGDETTGIISVHDSGFTVNGSDAWYTLDGRKLSGKPTRRGLYIHNGIKVVIK